MQLYLKMQAILSRGNDIEHWMDIRCWGLPKSKAQLATCCFLERMQFIPKTTISHFNHFFNHLIEYDHSSF